MADRNQLALLKKGVGQWNAWREKHRELLLDLTKANLPPMSQQEIVQAALGKWLEEN